MNQDAEHLRLLSIFHYVVAGVAGLFALFPTFHLLMGIFMVSGTFAGTEEPAPALFGWFFILFAAGWIGCGIAFAVALAVAGRDLRLRRRYTFCLVMAALACCFMPFGTVLGVFTIVVLMRPSVRASFGVGEAS